MALGVDSPSNRNEYQESSWEIMGGRRVRLKILPPSVSQLSRKRKTLDLSQLYGPSRPVRGAAYLPPIINDTIASLRIRLNSFQ
jgi:hypothetical protein